jgi:hypothetical protein
VTGRLGVVAEAAGHERVGLTREGHFETRLVARIGDVDSHGRGVNVEGGAVNQIQDGGDIGWSEAELRAAQHRAVLARDAVVHGDLDVPGNDEVDDAGAPGSAA